MDKNQELMKSAISLLQKVDIESVKYKNTFRHTVSELECLCNDYNEKKKPKKTKTNEK
jgi:hypothetical protein